MFEEGKTTLATLLKEVCGRFAGAEYMSHVSTYLHNCQHTAQDVVRAGNMLCIGEVDQMVMHVLFVAHKRSPEQK
jgi:hypothetical protein